MSKILIVEDEETIADLEKDYLELSGFEVEVANDGETGLEKALKDEYSLFILDLMLPGVDGFEICKKIHQSSWYPQRKTILTKSVGWDSVQTII